MIWIIGGTSEARELVNQIDDLDNFIVTVATESGKEFLDIKNVHMGRMSPQEMEDFIGEKGISTLVDMSHPYALVVSENAKKVAENKDIEYIRYIRKKSDMTDGVYLDSYEEACNYLKNIRGTVFFTTGSKNIGDFERVRGDNRYIYRVLPAIESIEECKKNNIHLKDIVALLGPFSKDFNKNMFREYNSDYVVMKDSGKKGGTMEKIEACEELQITPIIIDRKEEKGIDSLDEIENILRQRCQED